MTFCIFSPLCICNTSLFKSFLGSQSIFLSYSLLIVLISLSVMFLSVFSVYFLFFYDFLNLFFFFAVSSTVLSCSITLQYVHSHLRLCISATCGNLYLSEIKKININKYNIFIYHLMISELQFKAPNMLLYIFLMKTNINWNSNEIFVI